MSKSDGRCRERYRVESDAVGKTDPRDADERPDRSLRNLSVERKAKDAIVRVLISLCDGLVKSACRGASA